jgi:glycosyltransferase involved in cell wall biosynthesis
MSVDLLPTVHPASDAPAPGARAEPAIAAMRRDGLTILRADVPQIGRRVLYVNSYGMALAYRLWAAGEYAGHHLWGCLDLARRGYEILLPEPPPDGSKFKRLLTDHVAARVARRLSRDDIVYCGHNVLLWTALAKRLRQVRCKTVGLLFARETLPLAETYDGIIGLTPVACEHAQRIAPRAQRAHLGWGVELDSYHVHPYEPAFGLSCGKTFRDYDVVRRAFAQLPDIALNLICADAADLASAMPPNVRVVTGARADHSVSYADLRDVYYRQAAFSLIAITPDPRERRGIGFTNLLEAMALGRPVIITRTGGLLREVDVERERIGLYVEPGDADDLRRAVRQLVSAPSEAAAMGARGRALCERRYTIQRYARDLHEFFQRM